MRDQTFMTLMRLLPKSTLSTLVGTVTRAPVPSAVHQTAMRAFAKRFRVNMEEAEQGFEGYNTFAQFFTRRLKPGSRPIAEGEKVLVSPVDGVISQIGYASQGECIQAKGIHFPIEQLLNSAEEAAHFEQGAYATVYLSPRDYHRIHSPLAGTVTGYSYVPGEFWPVNPASVRTQKALFAINERLITYLQTPAGRVAVVAVGATCVARIHASYDNLTTHQGQGAHSRTYEHPITVQKGDELGMFEMGSTVILLFENGKIRWSPNWAPDAPVRLGVKLGEVL